MTNTKNKILIIDDEESIRFTFGEFLKDEGYAPDTVADYSSALAMMEKTNYDLIITDIFLKGKSGIDILREVNKRGLNSQVVMVTGIPEIATASEAVRLGAFDYISKPVLQDALLRVTRLALQHKKLADEKEKYRVNLDAVFKSVKDAIITVDNELVVTGVNEAAGEICDLAEEVVGNPLNSVQKECNGKCIEILRDTVATKRYREMYQLECFSNESDSQVVTVTTHPLVNGNNESLIETSSAVMVVRDITRLTDLERKLRDRNGFHNIVGRSDCMQSIYALIEDVANVQSTVLVTGESGTGKELVADALHEKSERSKKPFVKVNCSALSDNLLESELFGHVKGAFTGAFKDRDGRFQMADGGTIFLDEIGDISLKVQLLLLRVLQTREFERIGDSKPIKVDVRIVAATNQDLLDLVKNKKFRSDLFYRLNVIEIRTPALREREKDLELLQNHFINQFNKKFNKQILSVSPDVQKLFSSYSWPGNVRELEHAIERAAVVCRNGIIKIEHLPPVLKEFAAENINKFDDCIKDEEQLIIRALEKNGGNKTKAARLLGMSRRTIYRKIDEYDIKMPDL